MLSFFLCVGPAAQNIGAEELSLVGAALGARMLGASSFERVVSDDDTRRMWYAGDDALIWRGERWNLLCSRATRHAPTSKDLAFGRALHHAIEPLSAQGAEHQITQRLRGREQPEAWVAWSADLQTVLAFRDPVGQVPLYVYKLTDGVLLTNTRRALEPWVQHEPIASRSTLASLLAMGVTQSNHEGIFRNLSRIAPGHCARVSSDLHIVHERWWHWVAPPLRPISLEEASAQYRALLHAALDRTLCAPTLAVELSGGMDSTSVLAAARNIRPDLPVHAINYAVHPEDEDHVLARDLCAQWNYSFYRIDPRTPVDIQALDPATPTTALHTLQHLRSLNLDGPIDVLSGHGGDGLFRVQRRDIDRIRAELSPLQWLQLTRTHQKIHGQLPPMFLRERIGRGTTAHPMSEHLVPWVDRPTAHAMQRVVQEALARQDASTSTIESMTDHPRASSILEMADPGYHGLPIVYHFPLFDLRILRFIAAIPAIPWRFNKYLARHAWSPELPKRITARPKTLHAPSTLATPPSSAATLQASTHVQWVQHTALQQFLETPERFPRWTYASAHGVLSLLQWAGPNHIDRLTIGR